MTNDWQPIDTAPKDGTEVLLVVDGKVTFGCYTDDVPTGCEPYWWHASLNGFDVPEPTHWMPLPNPPSAP